MLETVAVTVPETATFPAASVTVQWKVALRLAPGPILPPVKVVVSLVGLLIDQVPDLFDAYCRRAGPVALPDFLATLAYAVASGWLVMRATNE